MDKDKLIIVGNGTVGIMDRQSALVRAALSLGNYITFDSMEQFAEHINGKFTPVIIVDDDVTDRLTTALKELELSLEPEHDFTVSYKDYLNGKRKNKRAMYKRR